MKKFQLIAMRDSNQWKLTEYWKSALPSVSIAIPRVVTEWQPFTVKYAPKYSGLLLSNQNVILKLSKFLRNAKNNTKKAILLSGNSGSGKSVCVELLAREMDLEIKCITPLEIACLRGSDTQNRARIDNLTAITGDFGIKPANPGQSLLLVDGLDGMHHFPMGKYLISRLQRIIPGSKSPIILICNNRFERSLKPLAECTEKLHFNSPSNELLLGFAKRVMLEEDPSWHQHMDRLERISNSLVNQSRGDVRYLLNLLEWTAKGLQTQHEYVVEDHHMDSKGNSDCNPFTIPHLIHKQLREGATTVKNARHITNSIYYSQLEEETVTKLLFENYPQNILGIEEQQEQPPWISWKTLSAASSLFSLADVFGKQMESANGNVITSNNGDGVLESTRTLLNTILPVGLQDPEIRWVSK